MGSSGFTVKVKMNPAYQIIREHGLDEKRKCDRTFKKYSR